jgi:hypothetical protein
MTRSAIEPLGAGRDAITRHAWREAFDLLTEADASGLLEPEDLGRRPEDPGDDLQSAMNGSGVSPDRWETICA